MAISVDKALAIIDHEGLNLRMIHIVIDRSMGGREKIRTICDDLPELEDLPPDLLFDDLFKRLKAKSADYRDVI
jgi:hypothetical protein